MAFIREPAVSGTFYPDNPKILARNIEKYLGNAVFEEIEGDIVGLISPHAGYMYSGQVAAYGYKAIAGREYDTVLIMAPSHRMYFEGIAILEKGSYRTPLGSVDIDEEIAAALLKTPTVVKPNAEAHKGEHSLEVQLPFLQVVLKEFKIVPLIMGTQTSDTCEKLVSAIYDALKDKNKRFLIIGSTDLSHYYPYFNALELDNTIVKHLKAFDTAGLIKDVERNKCEACGAGPVISTMMLSGRLGATESRVLKYANSGDVSGDKSSVVGYVSCLFYKKPGRAEGDGRW